MHRTRKLFNDERFLIKIMQMTFPTHSSKLLFQKIVLFYKVCSRGGAHKGIYFMNLLLSLRNLTERLASRKRLEISSMSCLLI